MSYRSPIRIAFQLGRESMNASHSERIVPVLEDNDNYKVCYRFLSNMLSKWEELGFESMPSEKEAIAIAALAHPYFEWAFKNSDKLEEFKRLYDSIKDVWDTEKSIMC